MTLSRPERIDLLMPRQPRAGTESAPREPLGSLAEIERAVIDATIAILAPGQRFVLLWSLQIGGHTVAGVQTKQRDGTVANLVPPPEVLAHLADHKRMSYDPNTGAWLSAEIFIAGPTRYKATYSTGTVADWMPEVSVEDLRAEFDAFPRPAAEIPDWIRTQLDWSTKMTG
ncbi:hypothetical protein BOX37_00850 [Nocardia mangyaensis]|uniref:Uncharacterized protein n=1 Tax=Nocardia mangyaensis TaxID=2213200 RepID=A0A1J0VL54_9NOCA|nr:hypothetical protein [Nocardia mangyaensis]APE32761.1 hypothetical protein BOX37_00850 [Nocardia mangyaensis]